MFPNDPLGLGSPHHDYALLSRLGGTYVLNLNRKCGPGQAGAYSCHHITIMKLRLHVSVFSLR